ncbi:MAG: MMPL family transporter [Flavobacteriaceae bacterium]|jgi:predicted RND superfamily exporter protein|nr:MMPL family transporter [Flavobacteriaceae bacterium]MDC0909643.1 MMPL family transporter [Flavobacteriaceae bacterium]
MARVFLVGFWDSVSNLILKNRILIIALLSLATSFFISQWQYIKFSNTEANLLPDNHEVNLEYLDFTDKFGEEGNLIVIGVKDSLLFTTENLNAWNNLSKVLKDTSFVESVIAIGDLQKLKKDKKKQQFYLEPFIKDTIKSDIELISIKKELFEKYPFYDEFLFNTKTKSVRTAIHLKKSIVNEPGRETYINNVLIPKVKSFESNYNLDIKISGMPYVRTKNAENIKSEISTFVILALIITSIIFFLFFRSYRATFISLFVVMIGVVWTVGILGLFITNTPPGDFEISVLTGLIPPLIIVIGIPNCIFLINKYQHEVNKHGNKAKSLQKVITKIGNATLMTNVTTASGFATFIITNSKLLKEFGIVASLSILAIFILCILIIPIIYSFLPIPEEKHLEHLNRTWINSLGDWIEKTVKKSKINIYIISVLLLVTSIIGIYQIRISGSIIDDMPQKADWFDDIMFYEKEFNGIMPLEILINTKRKKGVTKLSTIKKMSKIEDVILEIPELSKPISMVSLVKYSKQAYYNGNPKYYQVPTSQENSFILSYAKNSTSGSDVDLIKNYVDSTGQYTRITAFMKDMEIEKMEEIEKKLNYEISKIMPSNNFEVSITGKAYLFQKGTKYLVKNLIISLSLAIFLIALLMAYMFRSLKMIFISLIPNLLPLIVTAGLMGYLGVAIKPSTILIFSIAFGIAVDDTIHFLAKYRQELITNNWEVKKSVYNALRETGVSMFYTSIVLFFGFSVFTVSNFGGTVALGALVSATLLFAMLSNLLLLPSMLLSLEGSIANEKVLKEPLIKIIEDEDVVN